ncbi:hypothetical protein SeLEV6574_g06942 [Synchytrium endobioticum]|uniref:Uncharacterized protein n=1 Tax=Synchytrium endobioticum TaxID=286115 RepID=A0A507CMF9_9FUNG|nr:hypothetical protein SeLEV6574_g06942 [Synchytrium endobioticum]
MVSITRSYHDDDTTMLRHCHQRQLATLQGTAILAYGQSPMQHSPQGTAILAYGQSPMVSITRSYHDDDTTMLRHCHQRQLATLQGTAILVYGQSPMQHSPQGTAILAYGQSPMVSITRSYHDDDTTMLRHCHQRQLATLQGTAILVYGQSPMQHSPQGTAILAYGQSPMVSITRSYHDDDTTMLRHCHQRQLATLQGTAILVYGQSPMQHSPQGTAILAYGQSPMRHYKELLFLSMVNHQWSVSLGHITMMTPRC